MHFALHLHHANLHYSFCSPFQHYLHRSPEWLTFGAEAGSATPRHSTAQPPPFPRQCGRSSACNALKGCCGTILQPPRGAAAEGGRTTGGAAGGGAPLKSLEGGKGGSGVYTAAAALRVSSEPHGAVALLLVRKLNSLRACASAREACCSERPPLRRRAGEGGMVMQIGLQTKVAVAMAYTAFCVQY